MAPKDQTILITGASGFLASHIVDYFLRAGYQVRGTVRSAATAEKVQQTFPLYASQLSFAIVEDVAKPGAFDTAVKNVHGVIHTAAPFQVFGVEDNERDLLKPAIDGTLNILKSVHRFAPQVTRVVFTSSFAAMVDVTKGNWPGHTYSELDWNLTPYEAAAAKGVPAALAYSTAKALAERAAWDFVKSNKPNFNITAIMPPMIYGPNINATADLTKLNTSSMDIYRLMSPQSKSSDPVPENMFWSFVDVRDVAEAHLRAYQVAESGGERFFICKGNFTYQQFVDVLRANIPEIKDRVPIGNPGTGEVPADVYTVDTSKSQKILGLKYRPLEETIIDAARSLLKLEAQNA
ncbi:putative NAD dependent epimerase/dehydratase [Aspergillus uvarum CBS 121591]|uniref:Putative NAD dependent epimerase/dehydratase n=1 Tax=Aspergillus uvarum CBS 121591 TaxID=1448315 RepID=A0A319CFG7_9EURO|nr:putative NAD dependent epimerase/dehydratase [Aspergillus uvarum CBS 121591]PYH82077.1 putative NAD dependent epimerase/dehydratase [Aspergillus uvarum CBS 121591]